jgi:hypothetical protein
MKRKAKNITGVSHEECAIRRLREDPEFVVEYLKAALEDTEEPAVLRIALRRIAEATGGIQVSRPFVPEPYRGIDKPLAVRDRPTNRIIVAH